MKQLTGRTLLSSRPMYWLIFLLLTMALVQAAVYLDIVNERDFKQNLRTSVLNELSVVRARLEGNVASNLQTVRGLVAAISVEPAMDQARFSEFARPLIDGRNQIRNIGAAPDMVIRMIYPLEDNEEAVGLDLAAKPDQKAAIEQLQRTGGLVVAGPVPLVQGGQGLIGRIPVFIDSPGRAEPEFWGLVSAVVDVDKLFVASGLNQGLQTIQIAIRGKDGLGVYGEQFYGSAQVFEQQPVFSVVNLPSGSWQMAAIPVGGWPQHSPNAWWLRLGLLIGILLIVGPLLLVMYLLNRHQQDALRMRSLFELSPLGISLNEFDGGAFVEFNDALQEPTGYCQEELVKLRYADLTPGEYEAKVRLHREQLQQTGRYGPTEQEFLRKDGTRYPVLLNGVLIQDRFGKPMIWSIVEDISERKKTERALARQREALKQMSIHARVGAWEVDLVKGSIYWSRMTRVIHETPDGYVPDLDSAINFYKEGESRDTMRQAVERGIARGEPWNLELQLITGKGREIWVAATGQAEMRDNVCVRLYGSFQDIDNRKRRQLADAQVSRHNEVLAALTVHPAFLAGQLQAVKNELVERICYALQVESAGIWLFSPDQQQLVCVALYSSGGNTFEDGMVLNCSDYPSYFSALVARSHLAVADVTTHASTRELNQPLLQPLGISSLLDAAIPAGDGMVGVICAEHVGEARFWSKPECAFMVSLATLVGSVCASEQRHKAEQALIRARDDAEAAARIKSEFLATMSHEIRTPMNGVLGMLNLLLRPGLDADQLRKVTIARTSAESLLSLLNDILDFSKVDAGKLELEEVDFNLRVLLEELVESMAVRAQEKGLELVLDLSSIEQSHVKGDPGRLRQVFINLTGNAIKFTQQGEVLIRCGIQQDGAVLRLSGSVSDTGIGIPADKIPPLFDAFMQVDASTTRKYGGTGLGLAICKKICELMQGSLSVRSELNVGSCFEFELQLQPSELSRPVSSLADIRGLSLLLVDDNKTNRMMLRKQLECWGARVFEAASGAQALTLCQAHSKPVPTRSDTPIPAPFDIALLDMHMPGMDGAELGRRLKADARFRAMPLVMMTSMAHRGDADYFAVLGFAAYFPKPVITADLFVALAVVGAQPCETQDTPLITSHYLKSMNAEGAVLDLRDPIPWPFNTRLLIVDDNSVNIEVAKMMLAELGLVADVAGNGREALKAIVSSIELDPYTLVLMDCQMPEMDGYEATRRIRAGEAGAQNSNLIIVAMTANAMKGDLEACLQAGMNDYLSKPMDVETLAAKLRLWLIAGGDESRLGSVGVGSAPAGDEEEELAMEMNTSDDVPASTDWNPAAALAMLKGRDERLRVLLQTFCDSLPERLEQLNIAIENRDIQQIKNVAHSLKGSAGQLKAPKLHAFAIALEAAALDRNEVLADLLLPGFRSACDALQQRFLRYLEHS